MWHRSRESVASFRFIQFHFRNSHCRSKQPTFHWRDWKVSGENTHHKTADFHSQLGLWIDSDRSRVSCRPGRRHLFAIRYSHMATIALSPSMNFISMSRHSSNVENSHFAVGLAHAFEFNFFASYVRSESKSSPKSQSHSTVSATENIDPFAIYINGERQPQWSAFHWQVN